VYCKWTVTAINSTVYETPIVLQKVQHFGIFWQKTAAMLAYDIASSTEQPLRWHTGSLPYVVVNYKF